MKTLKESLESNPSNSRVIKSQLFFPFSPLFCLGFFVSESIRSEEWEVRRVDVESFPPPLRKTQMEKPLKN